MNLDAYYTAEEIAALNKLEFHWSETNKEFFSDALDYEMGVYRDSYDSSFVLRSRRWNDDFCEYKDDYDHFATFAELVAYLS